MEKRLSTRRLTDAATALLITVLVFLLVFFSLGRGCVMGDDHSAYILQGIAIAEGSFEEQTRLNYILHPSYMPDEAEDGRLVYVWGYSLILALVYALVGYDRLGFSSMFFYKLPSAIAFALLAGLLYLFLRRRFSRGLSFFLSWMFSLCGEFYFFVNTVYSDIVFLFLALLTLYLWELFLDSAGRRRLILGAAAGCVMALMYETRLSGISILLCCAAAQGLHFLRLRRLPRGRALLTELLPYALFLALKILGEAVFAPATGNASDLAGTNLGIILGNLMFYYTQIREFFGSLWDNVLMGLMYLGYAPEGGSALYYARSALTYMSLALCLLGLLCEGFNREGHLTLLCAGTLGVSSMLFYNQGLRYIYPILPALLLFAGHGAVWLAKGIVGLIRLPEKGRRAIALASLAPMLMLCALAAYPRYLEDRALMANDRVEAEAADPTYYNAFSPAAMEAYDYVNQNVGEEEVVGFFKPRLLYLNTGRLSVSPLTEIGHSLDECGWYLVFRRFPTYPEPTEDFAPVWENGDFIMYKRGA